MQKADTISDNKITKSLILFMLTVPFEIKLA